MMSVLGESLCAVPPPTSPEDGGGLEEAIEDGATPRLRSGYLALPAFGEGWEGNPKPGAWNLCSVQPIDVFLVGGFIHQAVEIGLVADLQLGEPAFAHGVLVDRRGRIGQRGVD